MMFLSYVQIGALAFLCGASGFFFGYALGCYKFDKYIKERYK